jgi:hypothetical protein
MMAVSGRDDTCSGGDLQVREDVKVMPHYTEDKELKPAGDLTEKGGLSLVWRRRAAALEDKWRCRWLLELRVAGVREA